MAFVFRWRYGSVSTAWPLGLVLLSGLFFLPAEVSWGDSGHNWVGAVYPAEAVTVKSDLNALVGELHVVIGQPVNRGQALATLELQELASQLSRSMAELRMARAQVVEEESMVELREAELKRRHLAGSSISREELELAEQMFKAAKAKRASVRAHLEAVQADHELLLLKQRRTSVLAPIDGLVQERRIRTGDRVYEGDVLFEIVSPDRLYVRFAVPDGERADLRIGQTVWLDNATAAEVVALAPAADAVTGMVVAEARLIDAEAKMLGRGVRVNLSRSISLPSHGEAGE